jgi:hypothetical protein
MLFADVVLRFCGEVFPDEKKKYRIARVPSTSNMSSCGSPIVWSAIVSVLEESLKWRVE